ncbi:FmdB family regulatory protein [Thermosulfidibacter takaii ABI70S6]|uniref:FmdB family regulatory protein n=1 Tax=Thermosulfidibacter takaii (strain DSM 17441 / JCM 13301 / NBRC 103674 / ABI70S6) TaxID=1298851 RepID=A0A0S3QU18_THET7|nr:zinc ribbon domain-containing protein [Thermosulfidibacter takaii]BAT71813.1 FmdB family regulatory protein [Thermosulfidibacter takaii ABI70S6]
MPIYEYKCPNCGWEKEVLVLGEEEVPSCISCGISMKRKISCFSYKADRTAERERNIMKLASDYLKDGKVQDAARFMKKASEYVKTDNIKKASEALNKIASKD